MSRIKPQFAQISLLLTIICSINSVAAFGVGNHKYYTTKKSKCLNPPRTARRVENFISQCQEEVKNQLVKEAYQILKDEAAKNHPQIIENHDYAFHLIGNRDGQEKPFEINPNDIWLPTPTPPNHSQDLYEIIYHSNYMDLKPEYESHKNRVARLLHRIRRIHDIGHNVNIYHPTLVPYEDKRIAGCLLHCVYAKNNAIDKNGWPTLDGLVNFYSEGVNEHGFFMATLRSVNLCLRAVTNKYGVDRRKLPEQGESCDVAFDVFDCISDQITGYCLDQYQ